MTRRGNLTARTDGRRTDREWQSTNWFCGGLLI